MVKVNIFGQMDHFIWDTSKKATGKDSESGYLSNSKVKNTLDSIQMTRSMELVNTFGRMVVFTKEIFRLIRSKYLFI
jgi:hypothetical protein